MKMYKSYLIILLISMLSTNAVFGMENESFFSKWLTGAKNYWNSESAEITLRDENGDPIETIQSATLAPTPVIQEVTVQAPLEQSIPITIKSNKSDIIVGVAVLAGLGFLTYKLVKRFVVPYYTKHISKKNIISTSEMNIERHLEPHELEIS